MVSSIEKILEEQGLAVSIIQLLLVVGPFFGFIYGLICCRKKSPLFTQLVVAAMGCMMLSRLYEAVIWLTTGELPSGFNLSVLGDAGGFLFLSSASFGQMDGLVDGGEKKYRKYRLIPLIAPLLILVAGVALYAATQTVEVIFSELVVFLVTMFSSYFNLKHLIYPDVDFGILKSIRAYNGLTLMGNFAYLVMCCGEEMENERHFCIGAALMAVWYFAVIPVLKGGADKWTL